MRAAGINTAPSSSTTTTSSGNTATPPQAIGSCQLTKVSPATDGGAAAPWHQTGRPVVRTPARSRTTPSVMSAATPFFAMRAHRMSPKMPASVTPMASTTAMQPSGIASMAARVDFGEDQDFRRREILARRHEAKRECGPDEPRLSRPQRSRAPDPDVAQAFLQKDRGDGRRRDLGENFDDLGIGCHGEILLFGWRKLRCSRSGRHRCG